MSGAVKERKRARPVIGVGIDSRRKPTKCRMRTLCVVVLPPHFDDVPGVSQSIEQMLIEAFIAEPPIETLHESVLGGLAGLDIVPFHTSRLGPFQDRVTGELRAIVRNNHLRLASPTDEALEFARHPLTRQRRVHQDSQAFSAVIIDDAERPDPSTIAERVGHKVEAPSLIGAFRDQHGPPRSDGTLATTTLTNSEPFFLVETVNLLVIGMMTLPVEQNAQATIAKPSAFCRKLTQPLSQGLITACLLLVLESGPIEIGQGASPTLAEAVFIHRVMDGPSLHIGR